MQTITTAKTQKPQRGDSESRPDGSKGAATVHMIPLDQISANPQVRTKFSTSTLLELGADIKKRGLLQPIVVRPAGQGYTIVVGERRFRAMQLAGCVEAPAIVADVSDADMLETQLIENIQRENLGSKDLIEGVRALFEKHGEVKKVAAIINKSSAWVSKNLAIALSMGPLTVKILAANIKDKELIYSFAKLETLDTAAAIDLVDEVVAGRAKRKDVQEALREALTPTEEKAPAKDDATGDLFQETEAPSPNTPDADELQRQLTIAINALKNISFESRKTGKASMAQMERMRDLADIALEEISHAKV